ncbi:MAG TPA: hypothetical protein VGR35_01210 [Tepidisphaeraceae bacterium]|nr:hypothetical protein [Tepidisphaeraceae bacterium]
MARTLDFQSDPQLIALTDALRAGPGSPQWREAVNRLRAQGGDQADEYLLLCTAREHLASGRNYREIHASLGFSRKLLQAVEQEHAAPSRIAPTAGMIALLCGVVVIAVLASLGYFVWRSSEANWPPRQDLSQVYFTETVLDERLDDALKGWRRLGTLPLRFEKGLAAGDAPAGDAEFVGGALLWEQSVLPSKPMQIEATLRLPAPESNTVAQVFVTDDPSFSDARATSPHELAWTYRAGAVSIALPSGRIEASQFKPGPKQQTIEVRIQFDAQSAAIYTGGKRVWTGAHGLSAAKPRFIGVRFLAPAGEKADPAAAFTSIQLKKPRP